MTNDPKRYPTVFPLPPDYHGGMGLPDSIEVDPARELQGWVVDDDDQTITLLYDDAIILHGADGLTLLALHPLQEHL